jgi:hypothetical protein
MAMRGLTNLDFNKNRSVLSTGNSHHILERKLLSDDNWRNDRHFATVEQSERHSVRRQKLKLVMFFRQNVKS